jgi:hypothetical protein
MFSCAPAARSPRQVRRRLPGALPWGASPERPGLLVSGGKGTSAEACVRSEFMQELLGGAAWTALATPPTNHHATNRPQDARRLAADRHLAPGTYDDLAAWQAGLAKTRAADFAHGPGHVPVGERWPCRQYAICISHSVRLGHSRVLAPAPRMCRQTLPPHPNLPVLPYNHYSASLLLLRVLPVPRSSGGARGGPRAALGRPPIAGRRGGAGRSGAAQEPRAGLCR